MSYLNGSPRGPLGACCPSCAAGRPCATGLDPELAARAPALAVAGLVGLLAGFFLSKRRAR